MTGACFSSIVEPDKGILMADETIQSQWSPVARFVVVLAAGFIVIAGLQAASTIIAPLLLAIFLAILIDPVLERLRERGLPNWLASLILFLAVLLIGLAVIFFIYLSITQLQTNLPTYKQNLTGIFTAAEQALSAQGFDISSIETKGAFNPQTIARTSASVLGVLLSELSATLLVLLLLIFLLSEAPGFPDKARRAFGAESPILERMGTFNENVLGYMKVRTISNLFVGITFTILLLVLGVDSAFLWGFLAFTLSYIPTIGLVIASVPAITLALLEQGMTTAIIVTVGVLILNTISDNYISPKLSAEALELSPFAVFFSFVFWAWVLGPIGALLSVILTVGIKTVFEAYVETHRYAVLLGPTIEPIAPPDQNDFE